MATAADLVLMDSEELSTRLDESRKELFNLRFQMATGQLDNPARMGQVRRDVARILTVLREREIREAEGIEVEEMPRPARATRSAREAEEPEAEVEPAVAAGPGDEDQEEDA